MKLVYYRRLPADEPEVVGLREAKKRLKANGGEAWIEHYERDGTMFERTAVNVTGNHSHHRYNRHL